MKAFISYSHKDESVLEMLHKHLTQLRRDNLISTWTDKEITAGGQFNQAIASSLNNSDVFIALLSPDYIASNYCYEKEFQTALEMQKQDKMIIIPIIIEPCDWQNTPFNQFKALPKDGKEISAWENKNNAFVDIVQNIRKLISGSSEAKNDGEEKEFLTVPLSRNYRVQKDFDSIEKMEFVETTYQEVKKYLERFIQEVLQLDNIKARVLTNTTTDYVCLLVNRNKINTESQLNLSIISKNSNFYGNSNEKQLSYSIGNTSPLTFILSFDEYHLFWSESNVYSSSRNRKEISSKDIADKIWNEWLQSVGIL